MKRWPASRLPVAQGCTTTSPDANGPWSGRAWKKLLGTRGGWGAHLLFEGLLLDLALALMLQTLLFELLHVTIGGWESREGSAERVSGTHGPQNVMDRGGLRS